MLLIGGNEEFQFVVFEMTFIEFSGALKTNPDDSSVFYQTLGGKFGSICRLSNKITFVIK